MGQKVLVAFVLDETGSMQVCKKETIDGYNEYVKKARSRAQECPVHLDAVQRK